MTEINFNQLWQSQQSDGGMNPDEIIYKALQLQRKTRIKMILGNLLLLATMLFVIGIVLYYQPKMLTTKIGTLLVVVAIAMQLIASGKLVLLLRKNNSEMNSNDYLQQLLLLKKKNAFLQSTIMTWYFIILGLGIFLYMIEYTLRMTTLGMLMTYGITALWIAFNWLYVRPRTIKKQQQKLNEVIANLESISSQFSENQ